MSGVGSQAAQRDPRALDRLQLGASSRRRRRRGFGSLWAWVVFILGALYFLVPLYATLEFSLRARPDFAAYSNTLDDPRFLGSLGFSFLVALITIVVSIAIIVPTAYWVRLRVPRWRPVIEFITLVPFVIPPVILVFGLIRNYSREPFRLTSSDLGTHILLIGAYVVLSFPYMYRAVDTGLSAMDIRTLTEAAQSLGAGWGRIILRIMLPGLRTALLSGAFLTLAIVIGEFTIANFLNADTFGPYLSFLGRNRAYEPAAVSLISFALTWVAMGAIAFIGRSTQQRVQVAGAR